MAKQKQITKPITRRPQPDSTPINPTTGKPMDY